MNIKTESEDFEMTENTNEFFDSIPGSPLNVEAKVEIFSEPNEIQSYFCSFCCKKFRSPILYQKHTEKHLSNWTFKYLRYPQT